MMAAPSHAAQALGRGRPSTSAASHPAALDVDSLTEEQVFGKKRRHHHANDPIESSLSSSQLILDQLAQAPPPPSAAPSTSAAATGAADASRVGQAAGAGASSTAAARIPVARKGAAKKSKLDFNPQSTATISTSPPPPPSTSTAPPAPSGKRPVSPEPEAAAGGVGALPTSGTAKRARVVGGAPGGVGGENGRPLGEDEVFGDRAGRKKVARANKKNLLQFLPPPPPPLARAPAASSSTASGYSLSVPPPANGAPLAHPSERSTDSTMPLQISDTPMIRRNQAMRAGLGVSSGSSPSSSSTGATAGAGKRKSSFGKRGNRASASFGEGRLAAPHALIPTDEFYRHVDRELPEAVRMRHLLVFLGKRLDGAEGKGKAKDDGGGEGGRVARIVKEVKEEALKAVLGAQCDTNPLGGQKSKSLLTAPSRPHPGNVANARLSAAGQAFIKRGKAEEALWSAAVKSANALQTRVCGALAGQGEWDVRERGEERLRELEKEEGEGEVMQLLRDVLGDKAAEAVDVDDLEFHIDTMHQVTQTAVQLSHESAHVLDGLFSKLSGALRTRATTAHQPAALAAAALARSGALAHGPGALLLPAAEREQRARAAAHAAAGGEDGPAGKVDAVDARRSLKRLAMLEGARPTLSARAALDELSALPPPVLASGGSQSSTPPDASGLPASLAASTSKKPSAAHLPPVTPRKGTATPRKGTGTTPFRSRTPGGAAQQAEAPLP